METHTTTMRSLILRVNDYLVVRVPVNRILGLCTQTGRLLGGLHQRSTFSRRLYVWERLITDSEFDPALFQGKQDPITGNLIGQVSQSCQFAVRLSTCL